MEHKICLLGKIFCETLHVNITKNWYQKVLTVFSTCIITGKVNVHLRVYQNKHKIHVKIRTVHITTSCKFLSN